jgi:hypothetical protein
VSTPSWALELADSFWRAAPAPEAYPRSLRPSVAFALPVTVLDQPGLCLEHVRAWLAESHVSLSCPAPDRRLRACLVARDGDGWVFVDASDPDDEQRLSLAHEIAHFLRHYQQPRQTAARRLGDRVLEVFDGRRAPTPTESLKALLTEAPLGCHLHLLAREPDGDPSAGVRVAEQEADRLAYELLAPAREALARLQFPSRAALAGLLRETFGLPDLHARRYAALLLPPAPVDPLLRRLGLDG